MTERTIDNLAIKVLAEKIMGWRYVTSFREFQESGPLRGDYLVMDKWVDESGNPAWGCGWNPAQYLEHAIILLDKIEGNIFLKKAPSDKYKWQCSVSDVAGGASDTLPVAITLAALHFLELQGDYTFDPPDALKKDDA